MLDLNQYYYSEGILCHGQILFPFTEGTVPAIVPTDISIHLVVMSLWDFVSSSRSLSNYMLWFGLVVGFVCSFVCLFLNCRIIKFVQEGQSLSLALYCI